MSYLTGDSLKVRIRIAFGASIAADPATWAWTDVTQWWHTPDDVSITWGRSSGAEQAETSTLSLTLKDTDGRFTAYDPRSPYWPNVRKWTPIQYDIDLGDGAGWRNRFSGFIRRWPLTWPGGSPFMALAKIEAVGVLGRLARGKPPARSAMRRSIAASGPVAYWPLEDGLAASQVGSATPESPPMTVTGAVKFVAIQDSSFGNGPTLRYGTTTLLDLSGGGTVSAAMPTAVAAATATAWTAYLGAYVDTAAASGDVVLLELDTPGGTYVRWQLVLRSVDNRTQVVAYNAAGTATTVIDASGGSTSFEVWDLSVWQNGPNISVGFFWSFGSYGPTGSVPGTLTGITAVRVNPTRATQSKEMPFGHVAIWGQQPAPVEAVFTDSYGTMVSGSPLSWNLETAHDRLARLAAEDGVTLTAPAVPVEGATRMGWQPVGTRLELYQQCETTDQGLIYESGFGLGYLPREARYNAPVALTIDTALRQLGMPFEPVDDDQMLRNVWTVEREGGSSALAADQESIDLQGEIEGSAKVYLATDDPLPDHTTWRLHLSTVQEPRYPAVSISLADHPELAAAWCGCRPGSRIQVVNPPKQNRPGTVDQLVVGATETYRGRRSWKATLGVVPASPWQVAKVDGEQRITAKGTTLAAAISSPTSASFLMQHTAEDGLWTTEAIYFSPPMLVYLGGPGGELVSLSGITTTGALTQTATGVTRSLNGVVRTWPAGTPVTIAVPAVMAL